MAVAFASDGAYRCRCAPEFIHRTGTTVVIALRPAARADTINQGIRDKSSTTVLLVQASRIVCTCSDERQLHADTE